MSDWFIRRFIYVVGIIFSLSMTFAVGILLATLSFPVSSVALGMMITFVVASAFILQYLFWANKKSA